MSKLRWLTAVLLAVVALPAVAMGQERGSVTGQVVAGDTQQPLQGVHVSIPSVNLTGTTDERGRFLFPSVPFGTHTVRAMYIGYRTGAADVTVSATTESIVITLETDPLRLDELVVVGYGTERRRNVAGAVSTLRAAEVVESTPVASVNNVLQGRLAGVQVTQNSGNPGGAMTVRVRGSSSITAGNQPLYVVDGVPMVQGNFSTIGGTFGGQQIDAIADLNPNDIETIQVLKDASAAAIYGSRASNGVVLITTRRGMTGRPEINFSSYYGGQEFWRKPQMLNAQQYIMIKEEAWENDEGEYWYGIDFWTLHGMDQPDPSIDVNWMDEVTRSGLDAPIANYEASIRGGTDRVRYYINGTAFTQEGVVRSMGYDRLSGRLNLDYQPADRLTMGTNIALTRAVTSRGRSDNTIYGPFANAIAIPPVQPVRNADGSWNLNTAYANPAALDNENDAEERAVRIIANAFGTLQLIEGVSMTLRGAVDQYMLRSRLYDSPVVGVYQGTGRGYAGNTAVNGLGGDLTLNFERLVAPNHNLSGVVGTGYSTSTEEYSLIEGTFFPTDQFRYITSAAVIASGTNSLTENSMMSFFGRLSYTFNDRVTTTFNIRADGSSRFGANNRYGTFPSASVLWRLSDEPFMQSQSLFTDLALRASYGRTGNQQGIGNFAARGLFGAGFAYNDEPGMGPTQLPNPDLKWETTDQLNFGGDVAFLDGRVSIGTDYYVKKTNDLLLNRPIPRASGYSVITQNVGSMENRGIELSTQLQVLRNPAPRGFNWTTTVNVARNRNKVLSLVNDEPILTGFVSRLEVGQPMGVFYGYVMDDLFRSEDQICYSQPGETAAQRNARCAAAGLAFQNAWTVPGDVRFRDLNGDGIINADDRTIIGNPWPDWEGGVTNSLSFRGLDLTAFVQFSLGNDVYHGTRLYMDGFGVYEDNHSIRALDRWTPDNPNATQPRATWFDDNRNNRSESSRWVEDGSYVRLKNLVLGYTIPTNTANRFGFRNVRVYLQGENLFTSTDYSGFDPEVNFAGDTAVTRGTDFYTMPQLRKITAGFNVGL
jgi:TonB-dependent starch-binding outer membrane protein SusC